MNIDINDIQADIQTELSAMAETGSLDAKAILDEMLTIIEPIDFYEEGHIDQGKSLSKQVYTIVVVEKILEIAREKHWDLATENTRIWRVGHFVGWNPCNGLKFISLQRLSLIC